MASYLWFAVVFILWASAIVLLALSIDVFLQRRQERRDARLLKRAAAEWSRMMRE